MKMKRAVMIAVLAVAMAALAVPLLGSRTHAAGGTSPKSSASPLAAQPTTAALPAASQRGTPLANGQVALPVDDNSGQFAAAPSAEVRKALGLTRAADAKAASQKIAQKILSGKQAGGAVTPQSGEPELLAGNSALSAALITTQGGRDNQLDEVV